MRGTCRQSLLAVAVVISAFVTIQPVLAQSSGVGCDGATRLLWKGINQSIALWKLDANLNFLTDAGFGPYKGWAPEAITTACNNNTYVLWLGLTADELAFNGTALIQQLDANLKFVTQQTYTQTGLFPDSLSADPSNNTLRLIWRGGNTISGTVIITGGTVTTSGGTVAISYLHPDLSVVKTVTYGPAPGFL
jgi:hypothetical protein